MEVDGLPMADVLAMLDMDTQGWAIARSVRADGRIVDFELVFLNEAGARILGPTPASELIGRRYRELWPETVTEETLTTYIRVVEERVPTVRTVYYDKRSVAGHFTFRIMPCGDGFATCFLDVSQLTLRSTTDAGARLFDVLDAAFDGFVLLRAMPGSGGTATDFVCEYLNQVGAKLTGLDAEAVIGRPISEITPGPLGRALLPRYRQVAATGESWRDQVPDAGGQVWDIKVTRVDVDFVAISYRDITEQVQQRDRVARSEASAVEAAERTAALQTVTAALAAASTPAEVYAAMGSVVRPSAGGHGLVVLLRDEARLVLRYHAGYEPAIVERLADIPVHHDYPAAEVARTGEARFISEVEEFVAAQPDPEKAIGSGGRRSWAFLPLAAAGRVLGSMVIGYREPHPFSPAEKETLRAFSGLCAQALQRALLFEAQRSIAADLQRALLPAVLPILRGARHAVRYLPWTHGADVGGDWYDVIQLGPDAVAVVIGDVAGHSPNAAATMGQLRNALRAYAAEGHSPTGVLERTNQLLLRVEPDAMATCCYLELHLAEGTGTAVLAGHPPPVMRTDGVAAPMTLRTGPPLGVRRDATYLDTSFLLPPGCNLLLYTDGLVEDRRYDIDQGLADLCDAVAAAPPSDPDALLDHVLAADVGPYPRSDDVAILSLSVEAGPEQQIRSAQRRFGGDAASAPAARRFAADILNAWSEGALIDNACLLLGEVITNAVQHTVGDVGVRLVLGPRQLRVEVRDRSDRQPDKRAVGAESETGRGLHIVEVLASDWGFEPRTGGGKVVWFALERQFGQ